MEERLSFMKVHLNKPQDLWDNVLWTDESKVEMVGLKVAWPEPSLEKSKCSISAETPHTHRQAQCWSDYGFWIVNFSPHLIHRFPLFLLINQKIMNYFNNIIIYTTLTVIYLSHPEIRVGSDQFLQYQQFKSVIKFKVN